MTHLRFYNVWESASAREREELVSVMRDSVSIFADQPGFLSLQAWVSETGHRIIVEADWASRQAFETAVGANPEAHAQRERMERLATASPDVYTLVFSQRPSVGPGAHHE